MEIREDERSGEGRERRGGRGGREGERRTEESTKEWQEREPMFSSSY